MGYDPYVAPRARDDLAPVIRLVPDRGPAPSKPLLDDAEILAAVIAGDGSAAAALHDRARPQIDRTIVRLLGRGDPDHEDLAQLSTIELVRSLARFRGDCSLDTWISKIAAHTVWKELRRRRSERRLFESGGDVDPPSVQDLDRDATLRSALGRVRRHLDAIESTKAWTVLLHDVCGYDLREIAEITEASVAAAQTRLVRGRRELHQRIAADPELADLLQGRVKK